MLEGLHAKGTNKAYGYQKNVATENEDHSDEHCHRHLACWDQDTNENCENFTIKSWITFLHTKMVSKWQKKFPRGFDTENNLSHTCILQT